MFKLKITNKDKTEKIIELDEKHRKDVEKFIKNQLVDNNMLFCHGYLCYYCSLINNCHCIIETVSGSPIRNIKSLEILEENEKVSLREMKECTIKKIDLIDTKNFPKNFIVNTLIEKGAPIKITRSNLFDISEYKDIEIKILGEITREEKPNGALYFKWGKIKYKKGE